MTTVVEAPERAEPPASNPRSPVSALTRRAAGSAVWSYAAHGSGRIIVFVGLAILARILSPEDFGLFAMAMVVVNFSELVRDVGLRTAVVYFSRTDSSPEMLDTSFVLSVGAGGMLTLCLFLLAPSAADFFGNALVGPMLRALAWYFLIVGLGTVPDAILSQRLQFGRRFWPETGAPLARYSIAIILALNGFGAWSLVVGHLSSALVSVTLRFAFAGWLPRFRVRLRNARRLLGYGWQAGSVNLIAAFILNTDYLFVGHFLGDNALGMYTLAFKLPDTTIAAIAFVSSQVLVSVYVKLDDGRDRAAFRDGLLQAVRYLGLILMPAAAGICVLAPVLVPLMFGDKWDDAVPVARLLTLWSLVHGVLFGVGSAFLAAGKPRLLVIAELIWAAVLIPSLFVAAHISLVAVGAAHLGSVLIYAAVNVVFITRLLGMRWTKPVAVLFPTAGAAAIMGLLLWLLLPFVAALPRPAIAAITIPLGALVYVGLMFLFDRPLVNHVQLLAAPMIRKLPLRPS